MSRSGRLSMAASSSFPTLQPVVDQSCTMSKVVRHSKCTPALQASLCYDRLRRSLSTLCAMIWTSLDPIQNLNRLQHLRPRPDVSSARAGDEHCANHVEWTRLLSLTSWKRARLCYRFSTPGWAGHLHLLTVGCFGLKRQTEHVVSTVFPQNTRTTKPTRLCNSLRAQNAFNNLSEEWEMFSCKAKSTFGTRN
jgi:hypothetical protein